LLIVTGAQSRVVYAQIAGLVTVALAGGSLVSVLGSTGAAAAAVAGSIVVWIVSHAFALRQLAPPPASSLVIRPLVLALLVAVAVQFTGMGPLSNAMCGFGLYIVAAPLIDRALVPDLVRLAHAKSAQAI
jgi:hypothetical protein